jgi:hypothetical protein
MRVYLGRTQLSRIGEFYNLFPSARLKWKSQFKHTMSAFPRHFVLTSHDITIVPLCLRLKSWLVEDHGGQVNCGKLRSFFDTLPDEDWELVSGKPGCFTKYVLRYPELYTLNNNVLISTYPNRFETTSDEYSEEGEEEESVSSSVSSEEVDAPLPFFGANGVWIKTELFIIRYSDLKEFWPVQLPLLS